MEPIRVLPRAGPPSHRPAALTGGHIEAHFLPLIYLSVNQPSAQHVPMGQGTPHPPTEDTAQSSANNAQVMQEVGGHAFILLGAL